MSKRKATCEHGQRPDFCSRCERKAEMARVIEACAEAAVKHYMTPGIDSPHAISEVRRVVRNAGRKAAGRGK